MSWQPGPAGPGTPFSHGTWQPGVSVLAASSAGFALVGLAPAFRSEERAWPRLWGPSTLICVILAFLLLPVVAASPTTKGPDRVYQQLAAPQGGSASLSEKCRSDEEIPPSTGPDDIQCQCKPGTFKDANSPEMCQTCSRGCPVGKVVARPCTPWNDIVCVDQESGSSLLPPVSIVTLFLFTCLVCFIC